MNRPASLFARACRRAARSPLLHFIVLGGLAFLARDLVFGPEPALSIGLSADEVRDLEDGWQRQTGRPPSESEREALIRSEVDDRLLLEDAFDRGWHRSDAIALRRLVQNQRFLAPDDPASDLELLERAFEQGMDRSDIVVRRRLLERMRLAIFAGAREPAPTRDELAAYLAAHPARFERPEQARISHVFLSRDRRGESLARDAEALGARLAAESVPPERASEFSDPLLVRSHLPLWSESRIARELGAPFAAEAMEAPVGRWTGPIESAYGLHQAYVHERTPRTQPPLDEVMSEVRAELLREREQRALRDYVTGLRARASVTIAGIPR